MLIHTESKQQYININEPSAFGTLTGKLLDLLSHGLQSGYTSIIFVCIGTDRSTGDSLGPLIGYKLKNIHYKNIHFYGNLEHPVHAKNIDETMKQIYLEYSRPLVVAVDACLGSMDHIGYVSTGIGSIKPGSGVKKNLSPVGDLYITGIVNFGGFMDFLVLQNTRLSLVMQMADLISTAIRFVLWKLQNNPLTFTLLQGCAP